MMKRTGGVLFVASMYNMAVLGSMCRFQELNCVSILTTGSQITIGSSVPEPDNARDSLRELIKGSAEIPSAVSIRVSKVLYRSH